MNSHWPYNICVILLRSMQTFAGLRDSSLPDPCLSATHYGTTKVTIKCQCTEKLNTTLSVEKRSDRKITLVLMSTMTIGRLCRQSLGRLYASYHGQSVWIQWTTEFRVTLLLNSVWDSRVGLAGIYDSVARAVSWYRLTTVTVRVNWNKLQFYSLLTISETTAICYGMMPHPVVQVYRVYLHLDDTSHAHSAWTTGSDNLRHYNRYYGQNYNYGTVGLLR